jgi:hypothetical protein
MKCFLCETELIQRQSIPNTHCCPNDDCPMEFMDLTDAQLGKIVLKKDLLALIPEMVCELAIDARHHFTYEDFVELFTKYLTEKFNSL